jgi:hypothetical protein
MDTALLGEQRLDGDCENDDVVTVGNPAITVTAAIETHPARLDVAHRLRERLAPLDTCFAVDPYPAGSRRAMRSARLAFAAADLDRTHHVVLQDDVWVPDGFAEAVRRVAELYPDAIVSLFVEWGLPTATLVRWAALTGATAVPVMENYAPTQAVLLPSELSRRFARYLREEVPTDFPDDVALLTFARRTRTPALLLVPNLVDHDRVPSPVGDYLPSLTGNAWQGARRSVCVLPEPFVGTDASVLEVPRMVPFMQWSGDCSATVYPHPYGNGGWLNTLEALDRWGLDHKALRADCWSTLHTPRYEQLLERIDESTLFAFWTTSVAMGMIQSTLWPEAAAVLPSRLADPVFAQALRTLAPGGMRRVVGLDDLAAHAVCLDVLAIHGMTYGAQVGQPPYEDILPVGGMFRFPYPADWSCSAL